jgi:hypothetical protein
MQREEFHGRLSCLLQSSQRAGCRNELAQGKQRSSFDCVSAPFEGFGFCFPDTAQSGAEKATAPPGGRTAPSCSRRQGRAVCVHWSEAKALDGRSARPRRRLLSGRADRENDD